ncbi:DUF5827 family protein [Halocatena pleomorpha]|uniref:Uncharacterized protein n=1 Tax=Halocatena pleomorpha TaxID=1785090 RepID=A0A3P3RAY6_9EURY|nr:DUF5827 family protein [Halocatena pleomorpha]RRJ30564.1 hypothetical protein EIK79_09810 [Halocatena pleomorpha]
MPRPKEAFEGTQPLTFKSPEEVLEEETMYTTYEIARLLQGLDPRVELDVETESVLLDWAIPWMMVNAESFVFAAPESDDEPGYYGLK